MGRTHYSRPTGSSGRALLITHSGKVFIRRKNLHADDTHHSPLTICQESLVRIILIRQSISELTPHDSRLTIVNRHSSEEKTYGLRESTSLLTTPHSPKNASPNHNPLHLARSLIDLCDLRIAH